MRELVLPLSLAILFMIIGYLWKGIDMGIWLSICSLFGSIIAELSNRTVEGK